MASNREERRLGRLRGAVKHQVQDVDFGTPFQLALVPQQYETRSESTPKEDGNREGPRLRRQRGAVEHQVQDADIKTPFRTDPVPKNWSSVKPQQESPQVRRTPRGDPGRPANVGAAQKRTVRTTASHATDANIKAKRMKLDAAQGNRASTPARGTESRIATRGDLHELAEDSQLEPGQTAFQSLRPSRVTGRALLGEQAVATSPQTAPAGGPRQKAHIQLTEEAGDGPHSETEDFGPSPRILKPNGARTVFRAVNGRPLGLPFDRAASKTLVLDEADLVDELSPERTAGSHLVRDQGQISGDEGEEEGDFDAIDNIEVTQNIMDQLRRPQKDVSGEKAEEIKRKDDKPQRDLELDDDLQYGHTRQRVIGKKSRVKTSPALQRQPRKPKQKPVKGRPAPRPRETIPVVIHRLTKHVHHRDDDTDADLLNEDVPFAKRSGVNSIDVLSQFCEEIIESGLQALEEGGSTAGDGATRREYRTKLRAVEAFQEELRTRLLELTIALDASYSLGRRVRGAQKHKILLREDLLHLRARRELIALQIDDVRIRHERDSEAAQDQQALNTNIHDIELAVSRALDHAPGEGEEPVLKLPGLATRLEALANGIGSGSKEGGILRRVREFNSFLERAAVTLETKASS